MVLDKIKKANDIKGLNTQEIDALPLEMRQFLIENLSKTGGHLASNLGVVELTIALHLSLDLPQDKIIWDVGHQSYVHKMLTGRQDGFESLRMYQGMSGFPKRKESPCDAFDTGHSSTSISAGLGYVKGRDIKGESYRVVSVIGDGALTGGMAYEALNNAATLDTNFIVILNDNNMSISENVGGMSKYLDGIRTGRLYNDIKHGIEKSITGIPVVGESIAKVVRRTKNSIKQMVVPGMFFEDMGVTYLGPVDGHNLKGLRRAIEEAKKVEGAVLVHVLTDKGKGYIPAELAPGKYHGTGPFKIEDGSATVAKGQATYTDVFGKKLVELAKGREDIVAITAAMADGTGLNTFAKAYPERFFDVGIAEQHGVTFAAGLAASGLKPVIALYSSFLQRAYDQVIHDVCIQELPVVFAIDRAGLVGNDGETHQGIFDVSFLMGMPNMTIVAPKNDVELEDMLAFCMDYNKPIAIRYARGQAYTGLNDVQSPIQYGKSEIIYKEKDIALLVVGHMMESAVCVREQLKEKGYKVSLVNARFVKPIDEELIDILVKDHTLLVTIEENVLVGGYGSEICMHAKHSNYDVDVLTLGIDDQYVEHGSIGDLRKEIQLDVDGMCQIIMDRYDKERD